MIFFYTLIKMKWKYLLDKPSNIHRTPQGVQLLFRRGNHSLFKA